MSTVVSKGDKLRVSQQWGLARVQLDNGHWRQVEENERSLEAMAHWRDPLEKQRIPRCRRHSLLDDNPTSG
jgi:hypothetical protein